MGILNVTPDSFSDGGHFVSADEALNRASTLIEQGADIVDIGGESTRPGADEVSLQQELDRVIPVIERLADETDTPLSIDTYKPAVMKAAIAAGASMVNDVNALREPGAIKCIGELNVPVCIMHMQGTPNSMQREPYYNDVVAEVSAFLSSRIEACVSAGLEQHDLIIDPGIGFGKTLQHNLALLAAIGTLGEQTGCEVLIGVSRKSLIDHLLDRPVDKRLAASIGLAVQAVLNGAKIVRVHDVQATHDAIRSVEAVSGVAANVSKNNQH